MAEYDKLVVVNPFPSSSKINMNHAPQTMWDVFHDEQSRGMGTFLGNFRAGNLQWHGLVASRTYAAADTDIHFQISPYWDGHFVTPHDLDTANFSPVAEKVLRFLREQTQAGKKAFFGYNIGPDEFKPTAQSWFNFHGHLVALDPSSLQHQFTDRLPYRLQEPMADVITDITYEWFQQQQLQPLHPSQAPFHGFPKAGVVLKLGNPTPEEVVKKVKIVDESYRQLHGTVISKIVGNYDDVGKNGQVALEPLPKPTIATNLAELQKQQFPQSKSAFDILTQRLTQTEDGKGIRRRSSDKDDPMNMITPSAYSVALEMHNGEVYMLVAPQLFRKAGFMEAAGVDLQRENVENASLTQRIANARTAFQALL